MIDRLRQVGACQQAALLAEQLELLLVLVLRITPAEASYLMIYVSILGILGRLLCSYLSDAIGRRLYSGTGFPSGRPKCDRIATRAP